MPGVPYWQRSARFFVESVFDLQEFRSSEHRLALVLLQILVLRHLLAPPPGFLPQMASRLVFRVSAQL